MLKQTILVTSLLLAASQAQAETRWFNNALNSLGLGSEKTEENVQQKSAEDALKAAASEDKASAIATEASQMVTDNAAMSSLTGLVTAQLGVTEQQAQGALARYLVSRSQRLMALTFSN